MKWMNEDKKEFLEDSLIAAILVGIGVAATPIF
jgi:hypothetical protein